MAKSPRKPGEAFSGVGGVGAKADTQKRASDRPSPGTVPPAVSWAGLDLKTIAILALVRVVEDEKSPAAAVASASRTLAEMAGLIGSRATEFAGDGGAISEMTAEDIQRELTRLGAADNG